MHITMLSRDNGAHHYRREDLSRIVAGGSLVPRSRMHTKAPYDASFDLMVSREGV